MSSRGCAFGLLFYDTCQYWKREMRIKYGVSTLFFAETKINLIFFCNQIILRNITYDTPTMRHVVNINKRINTPIQTWSHIDVTIQQLWNSNYFLFSWRKLGNVFCFSDVNSSTQYVLTYFLTKPDIINRVPFAH